MGHAATFLAVQWLRLCAFTARGVGSIPSWRNKILYAWPSQEKNLIFLKMGHATFNSNVTGLAS